MTKSTLKVMLDEDYLALHKHMPASNGTDSIGSQIVREIVIPEITKEVNTGNNFAPLRQIYQALILAKWYKETIQNGLLDAVYTNKNKVAGVNLSNPAVKEQIYERYLKAYKKGAFNYIKEAPTPDGQVVPRKYFSGGITKLEPDHVDRSSRQADVKSDGAMISLTVGLVVAGAVGGIIYFNRYKMYSDSKLLELLKFAEDKKDYKKYNSISDELHRRGHLAGEYIYEVVGHEGENKTEYIYPNNQSSWYTEETYWDPNGGAEVWGKIERDSAMSQPQKPTPNAAMFGPMLHHLSSAELDLLRESDETNRFISKRKRNDERIKKQIIQIETALGQTNEVAQQKADQVIAYLNEKPSNFKGEEVHVLSDTSEKGRVIGRIDRKIAEKFGYAHETANVIILDPNGDVVLQLRNKDNYDDHLAAYGGHLQVGESHSSGALDEVKQETGLKEFKSPMTFLGYESYNENGDNNRERRSWFIQRLTQDEWEKMKVYKAQDEKAVGASKLTDDRQTYKQKLSQLWNQGKGEVTGVYPVSIYNIEKALQKENTESKLSDKNNRYLSITDTFNGKVETKEAFFTPDSFDRLVKNPKLWDNIKTIVQVEYQNRLAGSGTSDDHMRPWQEELAGKYQAIMNPKQQSPDAAMLSRKEKLLEAFAENNFEVIPPMNSHTSPEIISAIRELEKNMLPRQMPDGFLTSVLKNNGAKIILARNKQTNNIVGYAFGVPQWIVPNSNYGDQRLTPKTFCVMSRQVMPRLQARGIGSALRMKLIQEAMNAGFTYYAFHQQNILNESQLLDEMRQLYGFWQIKIKFFKPKIMDGSQQYVVLQLEDQAMSQTPKQNAAQTTENLKTANTVTDEDFQELVSLRQKGLAGIHKNVDPRPVVPASENAVFNWRSASSEDKEALRHKQEQMFTEGQIAALDMVGGEATRFGGPKTFVKISDELGDFMEVKAANQRFIDRRFGRIVPRYAMTSEKRLGEFLKGLEDRNYYGLGRESIQPFVQGTVDTFILTDEEIEAKFKDPQTIAQYKAFAAKQREQNPDGIYRFKGETRKVPAGHFDAIASFVISGQMTDALKRGIKFISLENIDNLQAILKPDGMIAKFDEMGVDFGFILAEKNISFTITDSVGKKLADGLIVRFRDNVISFDGIKEYSGQAEKDGLRFVINQQEKRVDVFDISIGNKIETKYKIKSEPGGTLVQPADEDNNPVGEPVMKEEFELPKDFEHVNAPFFNTNSIVMRLDSVLRILGISKGQLENMNWDERSQLVREKLVKSIKPNFELKFHEVEGEYPQLGIVENGKTKIPVAQLTRIMLQSAHLPGVKVGYIFAPRVEVFAPVKYPEDLKIAAENNRQSLKAFTDYQETLPEKQAPGGIDLNQINVLRNGKTVNVQFDPAQLNQLEQGGFEGFTPVIINITHISSPFQLLGINPDRQPDTLAKV